MFVVYSLLFTVCILVSCATFDFSSSDVSAVEVLEFEQMGSIGDTIIATFTEEEDIAVFVNAVNSSRAMRGSSLDTDFANYALRFILNDGDNYVAFHLWIDEDPGFQSLIAEIEQNTEDGYRLTKGAVRDLIYILE